MPDFIDPFRTGVAPTAPPRPPTPLVARAGRGGPTPGTKPQTSSNLGLTSILHAVGIDPGYIKNVVEHPLAKLEGHGQFGIGGKYGPQVSAVPRQGYMKVGNKYVQIQGAQDIIQPPGAGGFIRGLGGKGLSEAAVKQAVSEAARIAKAQGHGIIEKVPVRVKPGETPPELGGELGRQVRAALPGAPRARAAQDLLYSQARGERIAKVNQTMKEIGGVAGHYAAKAHLQGELPKVDFPAFKEFTPDAIHQLMNHIHDTGVLNDFEKIAARESILNATTGKVPTEGEQKLLERVFGREGTQDIQGMSEWRDELGRNLAEVTNLPRAIMASTDLSAPLRQGLVAMVTHPIISGKNFVPMIKAFGSEKVYDGIMQEIAGRETWPLMNKAKLAIMDVHGHTLNQHEEMFMSRLFGKIPLLRGSGRAYVGFLNKTRADIFDHLIQEAAQQGRDPGDQHLLESVGRFVNMATGRGTLPKKLAPAAVALNSLLFSPRLLASRLNMLSPVFYAKLDPFARKEAAKAALSLVGTISMVAYLAKLGGASVNLDPRNADWAKIRFGNTRIDVAGGFQQPLRLIAQLASGKIVSSTTGKTLHLGPSGPGNLSRWDILERFGIQKLAPVPSLASDALHGRNTIGQKLSWGQEAQQHLSPLFIQDVISLYQSKGLAGALAGAIPGVFGVGLQTYGPKPPKPRGKGFLGTSGGFTGGSGGGFNNPFP